MLLFSLNCNSDLENTEDFYFVAKCLFLRSDHKKTNVFDIPIKSAIVRLPAELVMVTS